MSSVVRSWLRAWCTCCEKKQVFVLQPGWVLVCSECGHEKHLDRNGLLGEARSPVLTRASAGVVR